MGDVTTIGLDIAKSVFQAHGADASVAQGPYPITWAWSAALHAHPDAPDGVRYRARHDDSGFSVALFVRGEGKVEHLDSVELLDPMITREVGEWLDRYGVGLTSCVFRLNLPTCFAPS